MSHIFISYSKQDIEFVRYLRALLEAEGFAVWMDEVRLTPSARWWKSIEKNVETCSAFVVVMSPSAYESDWVEREILLAENKKRPIYPVLLTGEPWSRLANIQFEDLRAGLRAKLSHFFIESLRGHAPPRSRSVALTIEQGDIMTYEADVLAFKYAQGFHGVESKIASAVIARGDVPVEQLKVAVGQSSLIDTAGSSEIQAGRVLFVGTPRLRQIRYDHIRTFATNVLTALKQDAPDTRHLAMTIHGPGFGLDEIEALHSQFAGYKDALDDGFFPPALERITIVEISPDRVRRLRAALDEQLADAEDAEPFEYDWGYALKVFAPPADETADAVDTAEVKPVKPHGFVVLPLNNVLDDVFYYGIQTPIHALGLLCERIDVENEEGFTPDLLDNIKQRIETASVVVVELSHADAGVYVQLGYSWGKARPTILIARSADAIPFEAPIIIYDKIKDLETAIIQALDELKEQGFL